MIPYYTTDPIKCENCHDLIDVGDEAIEYDNCLFCDTECLTNHVAELNGAKSVYLTDDKMYKGAN